MITNKDSKIYVAGHNGMVGSAVVRELESCGYSRILKSSKELNLLNQNEVFNFLNETRPHCIIIAAAKVGGIFANNKYRSELIYINLQIQLNLIHGAPLAGVYNIIFLGSSCIYPRDCSQPIKEEYLLTGKLEHTNEPYAIAKIAGIKLCESYNIQFNTDYRSLMPTNIWHK